MRMFVLFIVIFIIRIRHRISNDLCHQHVHFGDPKWDLFAPQNQQKTRACFGGLEMRPGGPVLRHGGLEFP